MAKAIECISLVFGIDQIIKSQPLITDLSVLPKFKHAAEDQYYTQVRCIYVAVSSQNVLICQF
jgi:hypothetical protein